MDGNIKNLIDLFLAKLMSFSKTSCDILNEEYRDLINALDQAVADETVYFTDTGKKNPTNLKLKILKKCLLHGLNNFRL